jgi:hypothetical protein
MARRGINISIEKVQRRLCKHPTQYRFVIKGANHKVVATGEEYHNLRDLVSTVELITGVVVPAEVGHHYVNFDLDGGSYSVSSYA